MKKFVNYQLFLSDLLTLAPPPPPPQLFLYINCIQNRLLRVSFIELFDNILPLATSQIAHLPVCHQFNHVCTANFEATF